MSGFLLEDRGVLYRRKCKHIRTYYEIVAMSSAYPDHVADPRNALLQLMVAATPHDTVGLEILNDHDQIRGNMTSQIEPHFTGENYGTLVKMIGNVPDAVSPVKAKPVYFQLFDGDETVLVRLGW
jgi:extracellular elastinolytic metalloproteinase